MYLSECWGSQSPRGSPCLSVLAARSGQICTEIILSRKVCLCKGPDPKHLDSGSAVWQNGGCLCPWWLALLFDIILTRRSWAVWKCMYLISARSQACLFAPQKRSPAWKHLRNSCWLPFLLPKPSIAPTLSSILLQSRQTWVPFPRDLWILGCLWCSQIEAPPDRIVESGVQGLWAEPCRYICRTLARVHWCWSRTACWGRGSYSWAQHPARVACSHCVGY